MSGLHYMVQPFFCVFFSLTVRELLPIFPFLAMLFPYITDRPLRPLRRPAKPWQAHSSVFRTGGFSIMSEYQFHAEQARDNLVEAIRNIVNAK